MEYICTECTLTFSKHCNLRSHLKKFHPDKLNIIAPNKKFKCVAICNKCRKRFSKYSNLKRHVTKFHPENDVNELTSPKIYQYQCSKCQKNFSHLNNLRSHQKIHVRDNIDIEKKDQALKKCSLCDYTNALKSNLILHFEEYHNIIMERQDIHFSSEPEFEKWKIDWEKKNYSSYVTYSHPYTTTEGTKKTTYICHRSGFYVKKGQDMRHLKTQGSNKINGICPSEMKVSILENGTVNANFIRTHIGHDNDLGHVNITGNEKMEIASKIASKIPLVSILDDVRDSVTNNKLARMHLLTKKDLHNISQSFNLNSEGIRHKNEVLSIESWIYEVQDSGIILFYKSQGVLCDDFPCLKKEDFLLIIMHPGQLEVLEKYSEDVICIDGTHGLNAHDFELTTLLILDDMREGFPCCFMFGNRSDEEIMTIFFIKIKEKLERAIKPQVFMSDMAQFYYSAWLQIMTPAKFRLFCTWHIDRAWRKNLNKVDSEEQKVIVYKQLRTLLQETDAAAFTNMLENFLACLLSSAKTQEFGQYFQKYYLDNLESWAYCYRLRAGINTNMSIERMHQTIKYLYLNGKQVRRLDKTINTLMKLIKDKLFEQIITLNKGKVSSKIRELRKRHKTSHDLDIGTVVLSEMGWEVPSSSTNEVYLIQKNKPNCDCKLVCTSCEACLHSYSCTCLDNSIRWNMCKHIHLVCQFMKGDKIHDTDDISEGAIPEEGVTDMTRLTVLDEAVINKNLKIRYKKDNIYTYTGSILVAVNPYKDIDIYSQDYINKYHNRKLSELEPHVFALAEAAYSSLQTCVPVVGQSHKNQSLVISGESGAGKTESTKFILQYLCSVTSGVSAWVEQQILEANTILEAFGNAKTVRNNNSSRFGKFMQVCFDSRWMIAGCIVQDYLLEQSRITFQGSGERNYHVFYQLVEEAKHNNELATHLHLKDAKFYNYLNQSDCFKLDADARRLDSLRLAFQVLQVPANMCNGIFQTLSAILWLGNLIFEDVDGERCQLTQEDENIVEILSKLLGLGIDNLRQVVLLRQINVRGNITEIPLTKQQAGENRHAMAKALYSRTFAWLINHINTCINPGQDSSRFLGVLDIFGFENFLINSFEQLCINYTNEKLHKFFNHYVFALEQEIYQQEEIAFNHIFFTDNTLCLELLEKPPRCILRLLSEQCHLPRGCDASYISNLHAEFENHERYVKGEDRRRWETEFGVKHYAGCVTYNVKGFVDKNRDVQQDVFFDIISRSTNEFVQDLSTFQDLSLKSQTTNGVSTVSRGTSKGKPTVSDNFRHQLQALVDVLQSTTPWYVRCIKPNKDKLPNDYDDALVLDQLKYLGMLDIIRIRKEGFPIHMSYEDFVLRYHCLSKNRLPPDVRKASLSLIDSYKLPKTEWQLGKSKVFMRSHVHEPLEDARNKMIKAKTVLIQKTWRMYKAKKDFIRIRSAVLKIQHAYKGWKLRIVFLKKRRAAIVIQSHLRGVFAREVAAALREMRRVEEEMRKRERLEEERKQKEAERLERERQAKEAEAARLAAEKERESQEMEAIPPPPIPPILQNGNLEESERAAEHEIAALSQMAEQLKPHLNESAAESVDLDNLFAFLSDVTPQVGSRTNIIDEIGEKMNELVEDLDVELETVIQQELEGLAQEQQLPTPPKMGLPSLPEPTGPPPPPPPAFQTTPETPVAPHPVEERPQEKRRSKDEPIYESVLPREEPTIPVCVSPPPLPAPPKLPSESPRPTPTVSRSSSSLSQHWKHNNHEIPIQQLQQNNHQNSQQLEKLQQQVNNVEREQRRKFRVEKKLQELSENKEKENNVEDLHYDMVEFANQHFNSHERSPEGTIMATLTRKRQSSEMIPKYEMVTFYKGNTIPNSHMHLYDPDNINVACSIFRDLNKYIKGEFSGERELSVIQSIIGYALEREELRDEVYVQCIRQATNNPSPESTEKVWLLLCLFVVSFQPSKLLYRYFMSFLKKNISQDGKIAQFVQWCLDNCNNNKVTAREHPPSSVEVAAMKRLGTIVCRFFFLDGRTKAIDVHPTDTAQDAARKLAERLGLRNLEGWAIYQSRPDGEEHVRAHHYLYDIIAQWEQNQNKLTPPSGISTIGRRSGQGLSGGENRFIFKRRLFKASRQLSQDPVEINLLYAQAVHSVVKRDDFPVTEKVALQLAGLQAQVALGNPKDNNKLEYYTDIDTYLPYRISKTRGDDVWVPIIAQAHRQYGANRSELTAKALYLTCVMQYPLYGTTMFAVTYRGYWSYGNALTLGINCEGIMLIKNDDKFVLNEFRYQDIESILLDPSDSFITITLQRTVGENNHKCYVFETKQKNEIGSLIASYYPALAGWMTESEAPQKNKKSITNEDRVRLYHNLVNCRRALVDHDILRKPTDSSGSFLRNTLRRLSKHKLDKLRQEHGGDTGETYKGFHHAFWAFSKQPLLQSISKIPEAEEQIMLQVFQIILTYAGLGQNGEIIRRVEDEHVTLLQTILERCMRKESLLCELYLQLIKQTTDHPDPNSRVNLRHWALLSLACSVVLPPNKVIRRYLISHLKRCSSDYVTEEGKYARFAEKCLLKTQGTRRRQWPPSREEILCTINRRPVYARFHFMDGQYHSVEFNPSATAKDVLEVVRDKIGLCPDAKGYAIYEVLGNSERSLSADEKVADVMAKWERYRAASTANQTNNTGTAKKVRPQHHFFLFKKHLFMDNYINLNDTVEKELLYHQVLHDLRTDRFPITDKEAMMLTALQAQLELGDFDDTLHDYRPIACHCLPARMVPTVPQDGVQMHHQSLRGMTASEAKQAFLNLIQSWPLHKATIFDVMQSFTSNWPRVLWLAVDQKGLHLLEHRSRNTLCTYDYNSILSYSPALQCLMIITGSNHKQSKVILTTAQAFQIATLVREYMEVLHENMVEMRKVEQIRSRPVSALHPHAPLVPPQPS